MNKNQLTEQDLERHPIWGGEDGMGGLRSLNGENAASNYEGAVLLIAAKMILANGRAYAGYLTGNVSIVSYGIFVEGREYTFNPRVKKLWDQERQRLQTENPNITPVFPAYYESDYSHVLDIAREGELPQPVES